MQILRYNPPAKKEAMPAFGSRCISAAEKTILQKSACKKRKSSGRNQYRLYQEMNLLIHTPGILHAKTIIRSETIFFATARIFLEPGREFNY